MTTSAPPRLLEQLRAAIRARHYSRRTEEAYVLWARRFILFQGKRHPRDMGAPEVSGFLTALAVRDKVSASTQNQALSALLFLYGEVLRQPLPAIDVRVSGLVIPCTSRLCSRATKFAGFWRNCRACLG